MDNASASTKPSLWIALVLCAASLLAGIIHGAYIPYSFDELATVHIAQSPTWAETLKLSQTVDLNPPLEPSLVRLSTHVFGPHEFAGRLPSVLCFTIAVACLFFYLRRFVSVWFAACGALLLLCSDNISMYATVARPYALLLALLGIALLAYDSILRSGRYRIAARIFLLLAVTAMLLSHIFGLLIVGAFLLAEIVRTLQNRKLDLATCIALFLPLLACILYIPLLHTQHGLVFAPEYRPSLIRGVLVYNFFLVKPLALLIALTLAALLLFKNYPERPFLPSLNLSRVVWCLLLALLAIPILLAVVLRLKSPLGGFFPRYAIAIVYPGIFFLISFVVWRSRNSATLAKALLLAIALMTVLNNSDLLGQAHHLLRRGLLAAPDQVASTGGVNAIDPNLPLVENSGTAFMEADNRLTAADLSRFVYVTDRDEALRVGDSNMGEGVSDMAVPFHLRARVIPYRQFLQTFHTFLVLGEIDHHGDYFLQSVLNHGASAHYLGVFYFAGSHQPLWLVSLNPANNPANDPTKNQPPVHP